MEVYKYGGVQIWKFTKMEVHKKVKCTKMGKCTKMQVHKKTQVHKKHKYTNAKLIIYNNSNHSNQCTITILQYKMI